MEIREIQSKEQWEEFLSSCTEKTFLQSWNWGEFQKGVRGKVWRLGVWEGERLVAGALTVLVRARRGTFLLVPHGPVTQERERQQQSLELLVAKWKQMGAEEGAYAIRVNPIWQRSEELQLLFARLGFRASSSQTHPEASWKLEITPAEEDLLAQMRKTTRYLIRQTQKNEDIEIKVSRDSKDVEAFSSLHDKVSERQHFVPFSLEYLKGEFRAFSQDDQALLFLGLYRGELAAASFVVFWSGIGFYHHAASLPEFSRLSIPYLLQWEAILEAKRRGCALYDFWGFVDPQEQPHHPWAGPTKFKMGFGGKAHLYVKNQDLPLSWRYWPAALFETVRRKRRRL